MNMNDSGGIVFNEEAALVTKKLTEAFLPLIKGESIIIIHSGLTKLGFEKSAAYIYGVLNFLTQLLQDGKTLLLPSFTFSFSKRKQYSYNDPSETGALADLAREHLQFSRTNNPMFSFVINGPQKELFLNTRSDSGYGKGTAVSKLDSNDVAVVMLGASWETCTVIHAIEERYKVPYRSYIEWNYPANFGTGATNHSFTAFIRNDSYKTQLKFCRIREVLITNSQLRRSEINGITIEAANGGTIAGLASEMIEENPFYFVLLEN